MSPQPQTFANHRRLPPPAYAVALVMLLIEAVVRVVAVVRSPSLGSAWAVVAAAALVVIAYYARRSAQVVQDRVIRDEMWQRLERLLPVAGHGDIARLTLPQLVGLRFASDAELPGLVRDALAESLGNDAIKRRITAWQADWHRV
jgi:hypothetical protein